MLINQILSPTVDLAMDQPDELSQQLNGQKQAIYGLYFNLLSHVSDRLDSELSKEYAGDLTARIEQELKCWVSTKVYAVYRCRDQLFDELVERLSKSTTTALFAQLPSDLPSQLPARVKTSSLNGDSCRPELSDVFMNDSDLLSSIGDCSGVFNTSVLSNFDWNQEFDGLNWLDEMLDGSLEMHDDLSNIKYAGVGECDQIDDRLVQQMSRESQTLERGFKTIDKLDKLIDDELMIELLSLEQEAMNCESLEELPSVQSHRPVLSFVDGDDSFDFEIVRAPPQSDVNFESPTCSQIRSSDDPVRIFRDSGIQVDISRLGHSEAVALTNSIEDYIANGVTKVNRCVFDTTGKRFWIPDNGMTTGDSNRAVGHQVIRDHHENKRANTETTCDENKENKKKHRSGENRLNRSSAGDALQCVQPMNVSVTKQEVPCFEITKRITRSASKRKKQQEKSADPQPEEPQLKEQSNDLQPTSSPTGESRRRPKSSFPVKLYDLINDSTSDAVKWTPAGDSFEIDYELFGREYLAKNAFGSTKIVSLRSTLAAFGFRKLSATKNVYWHPNFKRDDKELLASLKVRSRPK